MSYQSSKIFGSPYSVRKNQHPYDHQDKQSMRTQSDQFEQNQTISDQNSYCQALQKLCQEKEQEVKRWKERAMKVESGFKEVQHLLQETDNMRNILEEKIIEVEHLQSINEQLYNENLTLKQSQNQFQGYQQELEVQIQNLEGQYQRRQSTQPSQDYYDQISKIEAQTKQIYDLTNLLEQLNKQLREKDQIIKKNDLQQVEKDNQLRQSRRDSELNQKKNLQREDDLKREFKRNLDENEEKFLKEGDEFNKERALYKQRVLDSDQSQQEYMKQSEDLKIKLNQLERDNLALNKEIQQLHQNHEQMSMNLQESQQQSTYNVITQKTKYGQELEIQRHNYEKHINKLNTDQILLEKKNQFYQDQINQKSLEMNDLSTNIINLKKENDLFLGELELSQQQNIELQKQRNLELQIMDGQYKDIMDQLVIKYTNQIKYLDQQLNHIKLSLDKQVKENEQIRMQLSEAAMKLNDFNDTQKHLVMENDTLRQTLHQIHRQRDQEDTDQEESKRKDIFQLKRYHETLLDQLNRENRGVRQMMDQKIKECEEWRSECLRLKSYLQ